MTAISPKRPWRFRDELTKPTFMALFPSDGSAGRSRHWHIQNGRLISMHEAITKLIL
jgi:hypothetical protein